MFTVANMLMSTLISYSNSTFISCFDYSKTFFFPITLKFKIINNCTDCAYKYGNWSGLKPHHILHTGENSYQCILCKVKFVGTQITIFTNDKRPHKLFEISVFVCIVCDFKCEHWCHLKPHLTLHISKNPLHWHVCNLKAVASCKTYHMLKTILELSYNTIIFQLINCCTKCAYKYGKWSCLEPHHILHTGENPYQCVVCKVNFVVTHILNLTTDKRPHELFDISVFVCIICDLKSEQWYHLKTHLTLHTDKNPPHWHMCNIKVVAIYKTYHMLQTILELFYNSMIFQLICYFTEGAYKYGYCSHCKDHFKLHIVKNLFLYHMDILKHQSNGYLNYLEQFLMPILLYIPIHTPLQLYFLIYYYKQCKLELIFVNTYIFDRGR